jgi:hypothetical protein
MARVAPQFPGAAEEKYTGPSHYAAAGAILCFIFRDRFIAPTPAEARAGKYIDVPIGATGQVMRVYVQPRTADGARLHFTGMGKAPPNGNGVYGDLHLIVRVQ